MGKKATLDSVPSFEETIAIEEEIPSFEETESIEETVSEEIPTETITESGELKPIISPVRQKIIDTLKPKVQEILSTEFFSDPANKEKFYETLSDRYTSEEIAQLKGEPVKRWGGVIDITGKSEPTPKIDKSLNSLQDVLKEPAVALEHGLKEGWHQVSNTGNVMATEGEGSAKINLVAGITKMVFGAANLIPAFAMFTGGIKAIEQPIPEVAGVFTIPEDVARKYLDFEATSEGGKALMELANFAVTAGVLKGIHKGGQQIVKLKEKGELGKVVKEGLEEFVNLPPEVQQQKINDYVEARTPEIKTENVSEQPSPFKPNEIQQKQFDNISALNKKLARTETPEHFTELKNINPNTPINSLPEGITANFNGKDGIIQRSETGEVIHRAFDGSESIITGGGDATPYSGKLQLNEGAYKDKHGEYLVEKTTDGYAVYRVSEGKKLTPAYEGDTPNIERRNAIISKALNKLPIEVAHDELQIKAQKITEDINKNPNGVTTPYLREQLLETERLMTETQEMLTNEQVIQSGAKVTRDQVLAEANGMSAESRLALEPVIQELNGKANPNINIPEEVKIELKPNEQKTKEETPVLTEEIEPLKTESNEKIKEGQKGKELLAETPEEIKPMEPVSSKVLPKEEINVYHDTEGKRIVTPEKAREFAIDYVNEDLIEVRAEKREPPKLDKRGNKIFEKKTSVTDQRIDAGMKNEEKIRAIKQIKAGEYDKPAAQHLIKILEDAYMKGDVPYLEGSGGKTRRFGLPVDDMVDLLHERKQANKIPKEEFEEAAAREESFADFVVTNDIRTLADAERAAFMYEDNSIVEKFQKLIDERTNKKPENITPSGKEGSREVSETERAAGISEADRIATDSGFKNRSELLGKFKKENPKRVAAIEKEKGRKIHVQDLSETELNLISKNKSGRIKQLETAIAEIEAERQKPDNFKFKDFTYRDYQAELASLKKKESAFLENQEAAQRGDLYRVPGNPFAKFEIVERLEATPDEIALGEQPVKIKNIKTGEIETVLEGDIKKIEPKKVSEKEVKEKFTTPVVKSGGFSFPIDVEPPAAIVQKHLTKEGNLPKEVFKDWVGAQGKINAQLEQINFTRKDFDKAVKQAYGKTVLGTPKISKAQLEIINDVLSNNLKDIDKLPEPIQKIVTDMRHQVDALSKELQRSGILTESGIAKVDENLGFYLTRSYRLHSDKSWNWNSIPDDVKIRAAQSILKEYPNKTLEQVEGLLKSFVNNADIAWDISSGTVLGAKNLGILKKRKDIPIEIREFLGEYKDPMYNYSTSISKMINLIEKHKFLEEVKLKGENTWLFDEPTGDFNVKIAAEGSKTMEPLNGLYTTKELAEAFHEFNAPAKSPDWLKNYMIINSMVKYSKTILSPITHARNFGSNFMLQAANGRMDFKAGAKTFETIKNKITNLDDVTFREYYKELAEKRVIDQSLQANELRLDLQDAIKYMDDFEKYGDNVIKKIRNKPLKVAEKAYLLEDNIHKIYAYEVERSRYEFLGEEAAKDRASEIVRLTMPTYSEVPLAIRNLRKFPLTGTFVTFPYEMMRTSYNTMELAIQELRNPQTRFIGAKRLAGFMTAATVTATLSTLTRSKNGMDVNDERDMRRFLAPWTVNSDILFLDNKGDGIYTYIDMGYSDPYNYLKKPANALFKGHRDKDLIDAATQFVQPFLGEELLAGKLIDLARNKKASSGGQVYNPELPYGEKWGKMISYLLESVEPGGVSSARRINDAFKKKINEYGGTGDPVNEIIGVATGQRIATLDVARSYKYRVFGTGKSLYQAVNIYNAKRYDEGVTEKEKQDALIEAQEAVDRIVTEASKDYSAAMKLGAPSKKLDDALEGMYLEKYRANSDIQKAIKRGVGLYLNSKGKLDLSPSK